VLAWERASARHTLARFSSVGLCGSFTLQHKSTSLASDVQFSPSSAVLMCAGRLGLLRARDNEGGCSSARLSLVTLALANIVAGLFSGVPCLRCRLGVKDHCTF
jgi:hypothetical protein